MFFKIYSVVSCGMQGLFYAEDEFGGRPIITCSHPHSVTQIARTYIFSTAILDRHHFSHSSCKGRFGDRSIRWSLACTKYSISTRYMAMISTQ